MAETYNFYVKIDGDIFGPYSAQEIKELELLEDILVTEESMNGLWLQASKFDFEDMAMKEKGIENTQEAPQLGISSSSHRLPPTEQSSFVINSDGSVSNLQEFEEEEIETYYNPYQIPPEIKKWNWGAFFFSWLWAVCNGVYWPLIIIVFNFIPFIGGLASLGIRIALGIKGNEWAWESKSWNNVEHFKRVQHRWSMVSLFVFSASIILLLIAISVK